MKHETPSQLEQMHLRFSQLSEPCQATLRAVFPLDTPLAMLSAGVQWSNLKTLWDYLTQSIGRLPESDIQGICQLYDYFFDCYNAVTHVYIRMETQVGEEVDEDKHSRSAHSRILGTVSRVYLQGFCNRSTGKIVQKSLVDIVS